MAKAYQPAEVEPAVYARWLAADVFAPDGAGSRAVAHTGALRHHHAAAERDRRAPSGPRGSLGDRGPHGPARTHAGSARRSGCRASTTPRSLRSGCCGASSPTRARPPRRWAASATSSGCGDTWSETRPIIMGQQRRLGAPRTGAASASRWTSGSARAVRVAFTRLYEDGLAYRGQKLVNWCPGCGTSVSDLEVIGTPAEGALWSIRYHLLPAGRRRPVRRRPRPDHQRGDDAPGDAPGRHGRRRPPRRPALSRTSSAARFASPSWSATCPSSPTMVEREFGTGAVKITPAHDHDDFATGQRHGLPMIDVMNDDGHDERTPARTPGSTREEARERILADLEARGDLVGRAAHEMVIGRCQRSDDIIEPRLKIQWFIDVKPMAERAMQAVRERRTRFVPPRFEKVFFDWLENIHDWNVSRQLWWGHRIPAWYCPDGHVTVSDDPAGPSRCATCGSARAGPGHRHVRHLVLERPVALLHAGLAGRDARPGDVLPDHRHGDRVRHPLLLGRPHDDARRVAHRPGAVLGRLPLRPRARPVRPEDVEDEGQRHRPARDHGRDRCRRPALRARERRGAGRRPAPRALAPRRRPQLRQQDLERGALRARSASRRSCPPTPP